MNQEHISKSDIHRNWVSGKVDVCIRSRFTGKLEVNFFEGGVTNTVTHKSEKPPKSTP